MTNAVELQIISKLLVCEDKDEINRLCQFDDSYYAIFRNEINFVLNHIKKYGDTPDVFTFLAEFPNFQRVDVKESADYLCDAIKKNKAQIVLVEMLNKLKDLGSDDIVEAWEYIRSQCDYVDSLYDNTPMDIIHDVEERAEQVQEYAKQERIPTGFKEMDNLIYGGFSTVEELCILVARTNTGKAQPMWSKVLTPNGWVRMGDIKVGDTVVGENNDNGQVVAIFPQGEIPYYKVSFDDGTYAECCGNHLWKVLNNKRRQRYNKHYAEHMVITTNEMIASMDKRYSVDISAPIEFESDFNEAEELDPYVLGVLIGDGGTRDGSIVITNSKPDIRQMVDSALKKHNCSTTNRSNGDYSIVGNVRGTNCNYVRQKLIEYGLLGKKSIDKFIPKKFLTAPVHVRMALLAGLVDTDGYIRGGNNNTYWEYDTASEQLAENFTELARSLGVRVVLHDREDSFYTQDGKRIKANGTRHIACRSMFNPFRTESKASKFHLKTVKSNQNMPKRHCKIITSIEYAGTTECQCIMLNNQTHTYITDGYNVTHNTWICTKIMESAQKNGFNCLYYSPEMQSSYLGVRFDVWRSHFKSASIINGQYDDDYLHYIKSLSKEQASAYVLEDKDVSSGQVNVQNLETLVRQLDIKLLIIDGLSYMADVKKSTVDHERYKNICADLFRMSKKYGCAVVVAVQANRETRGNVDEKGEPFPNLYNIEGSDHPARISTLAFSLRRIFSAQNMDTLEIRLEKSRNSKNNKTVLTYAWDVNTGNVRYIPSGESVEFEDTTTYVGISGVQSNTPTNSKFNESNDDIDLDGDIEF